MRLVFVAGLAAAVLPSAVGRRVVSEQDGPGPNGPWQQPPHGYNVPSADWQHPPSGYNVQPNYNAQPNYNVQPVKNPGVAYQTPVGHNALDVNAPMTGYLSHDWRPRGGPPLRKEELASLHRGRPGEPLIPGLVPPEGHIYEFKNKEKTRVAQAFFENIDTNEYKWEVDEVKAPGGTKWKIDQTIAKLKGNWRSNSWGHKSVHVFNSAGQEMFKIRMDKHVLNPFSLRWSFRILPAGSKDSGDALFTINRDLIGKGFLWRKEEWRIYRGRKRDEDMVYYAIGSWVGWDFKFYRSRAAYKAGDRRVLATISQKRNAGAIIGHNYLPDKFKLEVTSGQDAGLLLAVSTVIDMVHDSSGSSEGLIQ